MKPRRYLDEEVDVIASLRNLKGLWSDVVGIARARPVAAVFVGMILLAAIVPKPIRFEDYPRATDLSETRGCAVGYAALRERGIATRTGCTYVPAAGGGSIAVDHADGFTRYSFVVRTVGNQLHVQAWRPEQRGLMPKSLGVVAFARD